VVMGQRCKKSAEMGTILEQAYTEFRFYISFEVPVFADRNVLFEMLIYYWSFFREYFLIRIWLNIGTRYEINASAKTNWLYGRKLFLRSQ
jgi:hypothetical protein